jgi:peptidoglycan/xylan/chitin deacetylase (PgdA/CDA1 family)
LGHVLWLLARQPQLQVTLFTTPDWREISPFPTRAIRSRIPVVRDHTYLTPILPKGTMAIDRHPGFVRFLGGMPRTEIALHGLHHVHRGPSIPVEFQDEDRRTLRAKLAEAVAIFERAGVRWSPGMQPPGWNLTAALEAASRDIGLRWVASARDISTPVAPDAVTAMSGRSGVSLIYPQRLPSGLVHFTSNFQATSPIERAREIIEHGGLLAIKAHIVKFAMGHLALDGVDRLYMNYLDRVISELQRTYGDRIWWTTMGSIAARLEER